MNRAKQEYTTKIPEFLLNMQQIADEFSDDLYQIRFHYDQDPKRLIGVRLYQHQTSLMNQYVYIARAQDLPAVLSTHQIGSLICVGEPPESYWKSQFSMIIFPESTNLLPLFERVQSLFEKNCRWAMELQQALALDTGLDRLLELASGYFQNPVFAHDPHFFILSSPCYVNGMTKWETDQQTGLLRIPLTLMNDFKIDDEYQATLKTHGAQVFSANQRGYRILYHNLWNEYGSYEGRICINELQTPLLPGQYNALSYFAQIVLIALHKQEMNPETYTRPYITFLTRVIERTADADEINRWLNLSGWNHTDEYVCIRMILQERDTQIRISVQVCHHIESSIPGSYAFLYKNDIVILINLSASTLSFSDCLSKLAIITREGLFKTGFSTRYSRFEDTPWHYLQAGIALNYGMKSNSMFWNYQFDQFAMEYIKNQITEELPARQLACHKLLKLQEYDKANNTELYETLRCYLDHERNAVQTASTLFIHRSTLFYRLNRIKTLLDLNMDIPQNRLYLQLSYFLLDSET
ncbi:MAG: helix-turn-helix domain-containing protein [Lachnospiraceae bacterium]|nr:helix-turn-helix domain-containing protein [Lachnospiraceae bacterium]